MSPAVKCDKLTGLMITQIWILIMETTGIKFWLLSVKDRFIMVQSIIYSNLEIIGQSELHAYQVVGLLCV